MSTPNHEAIGRYRWSLESLIVACTFQAGRDPASSDPASSDEDRGRLSLTRFAQHLGLRTNVVRRVADAGGLTDVEADRWAVRAGFHPANIWGWDAWAHAGLDPHRVVQLLPEARRIAAEITAGGRRLLKTELIQALRSHGEPFSCARATDLWQRLHAERDCQALPEDQEPAA